MGTRLTAVPANAAFAARNAEVAEHTNEQHAQWHREVVAAKKSGKLNMRAEFPGKQQPQQVPLQVPPANLPPQKPQKHEKPKPSIVSRPGRVNPAAAAEKKPRHRLPHRLLRSSKPARSSNLQKV
eukprot:364926-Chlamydomonas_euryale.AAC.2